MKDIRNLITKLDEAVRADEAPEYTASGGNTFGYGRGYEDGLKTEDELADLIGQVESVDIGALARKVTNDLDTTDLEAKMSKAAESIVRAKNMDILPMDWKEKLWPFTSGAVGAVAGAGFFTAVLGGGFAALAATTDMSVPLTDAIVIIGMIAALGAGFGAADTMPDGEDEAYWSQYQRSNDAWNERGGMNSHIDELVSEIESWKADYVEFLKMRLEKVRGMRPRPSFLGKNRA